MRIIAGIHKGRRIEAGKDPQKLIRPTSDFAREAIFNILTHGRHGLNGHTFEGKRVMDLFCGTGALGLEALSRGAEKVLFVDNYREALATARHNAERMGEAEKAQFLLTDATRLGRATGAFDVVFLDPPYFKGMLASTLKSLASGGWIAEDGRIVLEHDAKENISLPEGFASVDMRRYGRAAVEIVTLTAAKV